MSKLSFYLKSLACQAIIVLFLFSGALSAYDFSDARRSLKRDVDLLRPGSPGKVAIVYNYSDYESIKRRFNLVKLKKELSHELAKSFKVVDPVIVQRVISSNDLSYNHLSADRLVFKNFVARVDCSLALMVELNLNNNALDGKMILMDSSRKPVSKVDLEIANESEDFDFDPIYDDEMSGGSLAGMDFSSPFSEKQSDSWTHFAPTALIGTSRHSLSVSLSFRDLAEVDVQPNFLRYDISFANTIQFGVQSYALSQKIKDKDDIIPRSNLESDKGLHSTYASAKIKIIDENILPVSIALGLRARLAWDDDNIEFNSAAHTSDNVKDAEEIDDRNKRLNALTLQAIVTGEERSLGLIYNVYLDNQAAAAGAKLFILPSVRLTGDFIYYWHEDPVVRSDAAAGVEVLNPMGVAGLKYQWETSQVQLEMTFNF